jgi:hypothetical protein
MTPHRRGSMLRGDDLILERVGHPTGRVYKLKVEV